MKLTRSQGDLGILQVRMLVEKGFNKVYFLFWREPFCMFRIRLELLLAPLQVEVAAGLEEREVGGNLWRNRI